MAPLLEEAFRESARWCFANPSLARFALTMAPPELQCHPW
jgi:hypothetical protein